MLRVSELMDPAPVSFLPTDNARAALAVLRAGGLVGAPVQTHSRRLLGYVTAEDLTTLGDRATVVDRMGTAAHTIHPAATAHEAARRLQMVTAEDLLVVEDGVLVGLVAAADVRHEVPNLPPTRPMEFRHFDPEHEVFWSDVFALDLDLVDLTPPSAGVILAAAPPPRPHFSWRRSVGTPAPDGRRVLITGHLRGRLRELVDEDGFAGFEVRLAEVTDPGRARRIQTTLEGQARPRLGLSVRCD